MYLIYCPPRTTSSGGGIGTLLFADNDGHALSIGIPLNAYYKASSTNTMGVPVGTVKENAGLS